MPGSTCVQSLHAPYSCLTRSIWGWDGMETKGLYSKGSCNITPNQVDVVWNNTFFFFSGFFGLNYREISKKGGTLWKPSRQRLLVVCVHCKVISHSVVDSKLFWFSSVLVPHWVTAADGKSKLCTSQSVVFSQILFTHWLLWFGLTFNFLGNALHMEKVALSVNFALISQNCFQ